MEIECLYRGSFLAEELFFTVLELGESGRVDDRGLTLLSCSRYACNVVPAYIDLPSHACTLEQGTLVPLPSEWNRNAQPRA
jgi:hypothetical protein